MFRKLQMPTKNVKDVCTKVYRLFFSIQSSYRIPKRLEYLHVYILVNLYASSSDLMCTYYSALSISWYSLDLA